MAGWIDEVHEYYCTDSDKMYNSIFNPQNIQLEAIAPSWQICEDRIRKKSDRPADLSDLD
jgi:hypothetical protein